MAFSNDEKQEIKDIVLETMTEQSDAVDYTEQVVEFAPGDEVPIVRNGDGTGEKSYGRAPVSMFGSGGSSGVNGIKVGGSGQVLTPTSGVVTLPAYESGAEKNPVKYLKEAAISQDGNSLTIKDNNNETKTFTPIGGGGGSVTPSDADPLEDGAKSAGSSALYSRGDHRHPHDTTKADKSEMAITQGTGDNTDKTTIQLKDGLSTTVLTQHQDISGKVDKVNGKGLSSNDYTTDEKNKLNGIETGAEKHKAPTSQEVKNALGTGSGTTKYLREDGEWATPSGVGNTADVNYDTNNKKITKTIDGVTSDVVTVATLKTDMNLAKGDVELGNVVNTGDSATPVSGGTTKFTTGGAYTELAKKVDKVTGKGLSTNDYTDAEKSKLAGIAAGAEVNVQSDWNATSGDAAILNKPTIPAAVAVKGDAETSYRIGNVNITPANIGLGNVGNFKAVSTVANQGLSNTEKSNARTNIGAGTSNFSGNYNDLSNKPTIPTVPTNVSAFTNDVGYLTQHQDISGKADKIDTYTKSEVDSDITQLRSELNAKQLQVGAVPTDSEPTRGSTNRVPSGDLYNTLGELVASYSFSYDAREHSSNVDRLNVKIKKGTVFSVFLQGSSTDFNRVVLYQNKHEMPPVGEDSYYEIFVNDGKRFIATACEDIDYLGFYLYNTTTLAQTINVEVRVFASDNAQQTISSIDDIESIIGFSKTFKIDNSISTNGWMNQPRHVGFVKKGQKYTLRIESSTGVTYSGTSSQIDFIRLCVYNYYGLDELTYNNESGRREQELYAITKTETFKPTTISFYARIDGLLAFAFLRIGANESVTVTLIPERIPDTIKLDMNRVHAIQQRYWKNSAGTTTYGDYGFDWYQSFLCITDVHSAWAAIERGFMYAEENCIDNVLLLGDTGESSGNLVNYQTRLEQVRLNCTKPSFAIPGNHEYEYVADSSYVGLTDAQTTSIYYSAAMRTKNGEIHPTIGGVLKNYYYKDITKTRSHAGNLGDESYTIRIIGLYQFEWNSPTDSSGNPIYGDGVGKDVPVYTQEQINWFVDTLKSTPSNVPVIILSHCHIANAKHTSSPFDAEYHRGANHPIFGLLSNTSFFYSIIDAWVRGTSCNVSSNQVTPDSVNHPISVSTTFSGTHKFIANICGHIHEGGILKMLDTTGGESNYYIVMSPSTNDGDYQNTGWFPRDPKTPKLMDCLNVYVYDYDYHRLKIARLGSDINGLGEDGKTYVIQL